MENTAVFIQSLIHDSVSVRVLDELSLDSPAFTSQPINRRIESEEKSI
jgi:hypothetical protein